jgi:hypothetical protein
VLSEHLRLQEFRATNHQGRPASEAVEQSNHLRHRSHLDRAGHPETEPTPHHDPGDDHGVGDRGLADQGDDHRHEHSETGDPVASNRRGWTREPLQSEHKADGRSEIEERYEGTRHYSPPVVGLRLNIWSMRSVTT